MNKRIASAIGIVLVMGIFFSNSAMAEKINAPITGWQASFWNRPEGENLSESDGGVEITVEPEWVFDGNASLHVWTAKSLPNFNAQAVQNISFEQGEDYRLTGNLYISSTSWGFGLYIGSDRLTMLRNLVPAGEWTEFDYTFTYQSKNTDLKFQTAQEGDLYADNLSLKKILYDENGEVIGYGEELLKNGDFESDYLPAGEVTELTAEAKDSGAVLRWRKPESENLESIVIFHGEEVLQTVDASQETVELDGLENGTSYVLTVRTQTTTGVLSDGCEVSVTPYKMVALPRVIKDDKENKIIGITEEMEYSLDEGQSWQAYEMSKPPALNGKVTVWVRYKNEEQGAVAPIQILYFTPNGIEQQIQISKVKFEGNDFVLEGALNRSEEASVTMYVLKQGADRRDFSAVLAIGQTVSASDGSFSFRKPVAEQRNGIETDGFYDVYIDSAITDEVKCERIAFASSQNLNKAAAALFEQTNTAALLEKDSEYYNAYLAMGLPLEEYHKHSERKAGVVSKFKSLLSDLNRSDENLFNNICGAFAKAYVMNELQYADSEAAYEMFKEYLEFLPLYYDGFTLDSIINESAPRLTFLMEYLAGKSYGSYELLNQGFAEGVALYEINEATYGILPKTLEKHSDVLKLNSAAYTRYQALRDGSIEKISASKKIVDIKSKTPFLSSEKVLDAIKTAMSSSQSVDNAGGSGGSGGGGGGSTNPGSVSPGFSIDNTIFSAQAAQNIQNVTEQPQNTKIFSDLENMEWAEESIEYLYSCGYIKGYDDGSFRPNQLITREEFVTILVRAFQLTDEKAECSFEDVSEQDWYYRSIASAVQAGLVKGIDERSFGAGQNISREELATLAYRSLSRLNVDFSSAADAVVFTDEEQISGYAKEAVNKLCGAGVVKGYQDGSFLPKNTATRAEACVILYRILVMEEANR